MFVLNEFCSLSQRFFSFQKEAPNLIGSFCIFVRFAVVVARNNPTNLDFDSVIRC